MAVVQSCSDCEVQVLNDKEKVEVHRLVLEMMKAVAVTEANTGVLNLKTTRRSVSPTAGSCGSSPGTSVSSPPSVSMAHPPTTNGGLKGLNLSPCERGSSPESHPFREYMDNQGVQDLSISDSEEIMAYVNMKVCLDDDDILGWWAGSSANGLPTLRKLARRVLAIPATCSRAHHIGQRAVAATAALPSTHHHRLNDILHVTYNL
ncbi:HAT C-terminal dimerization domain [Trinorchestia longiramus]|nr:HAT C-terminal dimerization domain [Trinorchestia longiramus]